MLEILKDQKKIRGKQKNKIASYFLENHNNIINMSIYEIADAIGVSPASITRFCSEMFGMSYMETKISLAKETKTDSEKNREIIGWGSNLETLPFNLMKELESCFKRLTFLNKPDFFEKCINEIVKSDRVIILGVGNSDIIAQDFFEKMIKIQKNALHSTSNQGATALLATPKDTILAISSSGLTKEVITAASYAKDRGAKVISITANTLNPLRKLADYAILEPNIEANARLGAIFSRYMGLFVVDILFIGIAQKTLETPDEIINSFNQLINNIHK